MDELIKLHNQFTSLMEKRARKAFLDAVVRTTKRSDFATAIDEIRAGKVDYIGGAIVGRLSNVELDLRPLEIVIRDSFIGGGRITAKAFGNSITKASTPVLAYDFDPSLPDAVEWARSNAVTMVRGINANTREAIRLRVMNALNSGLAPWELAEELQQVIGLTTRDVQAVEKYRQSMSLVFSRTRANQLAKTYARQLLSARATNIARTEVLKASNEGQQKYWQQGIQEGQIDPNQMVRVWIATIPSERTCATCGKLDGKTAHIDGTFKLSTSYYDLPPAHPQCRCTTGLIYATDVKKLDVIEKFNPNHDRLGRFASAPGGAGGVIRDEAITHGETKMDGDRIVHHEISLGRAEQWRQTLDQMHPTEALRVSNVRNLGGSDDITEYKTKTGAIRASKDWVDYTVVTIKGQTRSGDPIERHFSIRLNKATKEAIGIEAEITSGKTTRARAASLTVIKNAPTAAHQKALERISAAAPHATLSSALHKCTPDSLNATADGLKTMGKLYPHTLRQITSITHMPRSGSDAAITYRADNGLHGVELEVNRMGKYKADTYLLEGVRRRDQADRLGEPRWNATVSMQDVIHHEFGHAVQYAVTSRAGLDAFSIHRARAADGSEFGEIAASHASNAVVAKGVSKYALKNNFERGAEVWALAHVGGRYSEKDIPKELIPMLRSMRKAAQKQGRYPIEKSDREYGDRIVMDDFFMDSEEQRKLEAKINLKLLVDKYKKDDQ